MADSLLGRLFGRSPKSAGRVTGAPTSSNGASSFHLSWQVPPTPLERVEATFEVTEAPTGQRLYFWALQASFVAGGGQTVGGAHFGLQYHPDYPEGGAVNWGGYHAGGGELAGTESVLPSALDNVNTRTYRWFANRPYRLCIYRAQPGRWRGEIVDTETGEATVVRDLLVDADHLAAPMVWSEVFADCDDPSVTVRWSDFTTHTERGVITANSVHLNYQRHADGGCGNTNTWVDDAGRFAQTTNTQRHNRTGTVLTVGG